MVDKCVCCGAVIPEGGLVCQNCLVATNRPTKVKKIPTIKVVLDEGAKMPTRAHAWDAGLDLYSRDYCTLWANDSAKFDTGVHVEIPEGYVGFVKSKSGLMVNHDIVTDGTIDAHYTGSITVKLFNNGKKAYRVHEGEKIAQLVIVPCLIPELEVVEDLSPTDRGDGGFGSTGKF